MKSLTYKRWLAIVSGLAFLSCLVMLVCIKMGMESISWGTVTDILVRRICNRTIPEGIAATIILDIRVPRVIMAFFVGMALSVAGAVFQSLLRNPLAEPHLIGVSSGAALGTVSATIFFTTIGFGQVISGPGAAFLGALLAMSVIYVLSQRKGVLSMYTLLLVGVILNSFFVSIIIFLESIMHYDQLASVFSWLLGSLSFIDTNMLPIVCIVVCGGAVLLVLQTPQLNIVSLGETHAQSMGVAVEQVKRLSYITASLITGVVVSVSGLIGFVGLVVPHICRMLFGADHRTLIPASAFIGGILLVIADTIARTIIAPQEIPVGVVTSFLGAPFFIIVLKRKELQK